MFSHVGGLANVEPLMGPTQEGNQLRSSATVASMTSVTAPCGSNGAEPSARLQPQPRPQPEQDHGQEQEQKQGQGQAGVHGVAHRLSVFDASRLVLAQYERWCVVAAGRVRFNTRTCACGHACLCAYALGVGSGWGGCVMPLVAARQRQWTAYVSHTVQAPHAPTCPHVGARALPAACPALSSNALGPIMNAEDTG